MDDKLSKDKCSSIWADRGNLIYVKWNKSKPVHKDEETDQ